MFKKSTVGSQLPVQNNQYYLTVKSLKKLTNGDTVKLDQLICCTGKILKLAEKDEKDTSKLYIGSTDRNPISSTFIRYFRLDGKPEDLIDYWFYEDGLLDEGLLTAVKEAESG